MTLDDRHTDRPLHLRDASWFIQSFTIHAGSLLRASVWASKSLSWSLVHIFVRVKMSCNPEMKVMISGTLLLAVMRYGRYLRMSATIAFMDFCIRFYLGCDML